jgi:hypothetical protein
MNSPQLLERECTVFSEYLLGRAPHDYALRKYLEAHEVTTAFSPKDPFGVLLLRVARRHRLLTKVADSYARVFAPGTLLRKKLVLLLAILETSAPSCHVIDSVDGGSMVSLLSRLFVRGLGSTASLAIGTLVFVPARLVLAKGSRDGDV